MKLLKENKGSTLLTTMFFILVVALLTISLHLALISMINKVSDSYDQMQSYVSARGIVTTIAQGISATSEDELLAFDADEDLTVSEVQIGDDLLNFLDSIDDNEEKELKEITIGGIDIGQDNITGSIQRINVDTEAGTATYLLSITTTYGDESETVSLSITRETVQVPVDEVTETTITIASGYLSGFYLDFMPYTSSLTYAEDTFDNDDAIFVCDSPIIYTDPDIYFGMKAHFYCDGTVVLVGTEKNIKGDEYNADNGNVYGDYIDFFVKGDIHLKDIDEIQYVDFKATGNIYLYEGTEIEFYATITCDTLYIDDNVTIGNDVAVYANNIVYMGDPDAINTVSVSNTTTSINLGCAQSAVTGDALTLVNKFKTKTYNNEISTTMAFPSRNVPTYVTEYLSTDSSSITTVSNTTSYSFKAATEDPDGEIVYTFYKLDGSKSDYTFSTSNFSGYSDLTPIVIVVPAGVTVTTTDKIDDAGIYFYLAGSGAEYSNTAGDTSVRVYSDPLSDELQASYEQALLDCLGSDIFFTLNYAGTVTTTTVTTEVTYNKSTNKYTTKTTTTTVTTTTDIYGNSTSTQPSSSTKTTTSINGTIGTNTTITTTTNADSIYDSIQTNVFNILKEIYTTYTGIESSNNAEVTGTITANIIKSADPSITDSKNGLEIEYDQSNDLGEQNITREEWETYYVNYNSFSVGTYIE